MCNKDHVRYFVDTKLIPLYISNTVSDRYLRPEKMYHQLGRLLQKKSDRFFFFNTNSKFSDHFFSEKALSEEQLVRKLGKTEEAVTRKKVIRKFRISY